MDCAWYLIYKRMKETGKLDELRTMRSPRDWRKDRGSGVRRMCLKELAAEEAKQ
jgi:hypothetical protein